jgi:hypothetical protein
MPSKGESRPQHNVAQRAQALTMLQFSATLLKSQSTLEFHNDKFIITLKQLRSVDITPLFLL